MYVLLMVVLNMRLTDDQVQYVVSSNNNAMTYEQCEAERLNFLTENLEQNGLNALCLEVVS